MQQLRKIYRSNYAGEHIVGKLTLSDNAWDPSTEYIPNAVFNTHTTSRAVVIGNGESRQGFNLQHIANHKGGLLAADKLQSYGCNALYRDFTPDFLVAIGDTIVDEIAQSEYTKDNICYATSESVLKYPEQFYLVPQNLHYDAGALAAYLACFDGHTKVFLLGFDNYPGPETTNNIYKDTNGYPANNHVLNGDFFTKSLNMVMTTYSDVEFIRVMPNTAAYIPDGWKGITNFRQIDYRGFVTESDLG